MKKTNTPATKAVATKSNTEATSTKAETKKDTTKKSVKKDTTKSVEQKEKEELDQILGPEKPVKSTGKGKSKATKPAEPTPAPTETPVPTSVPDAPVKKSRKSKKAEVTPEQPRTEVVIAKNGKTYKIDNAKHTCKRIATSFEELDLEAMSLDAMPMELYQDYARKRFPGEEFPIKKNRLFFKGFRISCTAEEGFKVEDTTKRYRVVELPFEGIPSPQELVDFLLTPKASADPKPAKVVKSEKEEPVAPSVDVENPAECRKAVTKELARLAKKGEKLDIKLFSALVPFKRWQRTIRKFYKQFTDKKIRYAKLLQMITEYTKSESFVEEPKAPKYKFDGTILPEFNKVGMLVGDKLEVDGKKVDAVPFFVDYILHYVPKAMAQMMRWATGAISDFDLLKSPMEADPFIEFNKKEFKQNKHNADILSALCAAVGIVAPQDMLYTDELQVGDKILLWDEDRWATKTITSTEEGIEYGRGIGVMKFDKWIKIEPKKKEEK